MGIGMGNPILNNIDATDIQYLIQVICAWFFHCYFVTRVVAYGSYHHFLLDVDCVEQEGVSLLEVECCFRFIHKMIDK